MKVFGLIAVLSLLAVSAARAAPQRSMSQLWTDCSKATDKMKIQSITVSPNPPQKGDTLSIVANVTFDEDVTGGEVKVTLTIDKIPFIVKHLDFCELAEKSGLSCPIKAGPHVLTSPQIPIPDEAPSGTYGGKQYIYDQNNNELACLELNLHF